MSGFAKNNFAKSNADDIFRTGPETLAAQSPIIFAGSTSALNVKVIEAMEGEGATPLVWTVSGTIEKPQRLKGAGMVQGLNFSRRENSPFAFNQQPEPYWLADYGNLIEAGDSIVFLNSIEPLDIALIAPSGPGEQNLRLLVTQALAIEELDAKEKFTALINWLHSAKTEAERLAALRSLIRLGADWDVFSLAFKAIKTNLTPSLQEFVVGLITFALKQGIWPDQDIRPVQLICKMFYQENNIDRQPIAILPLKQLLAWADEDGTQKARAGITDVILDCLRQRRAASPLSEQLMQHYQQINANHKVL